MIRISPILAALAVAACTQPQAASKPPATVASISDQVNAGLAKAQTAATIATNLWQISKGIALVAGVDTSAGDAIAGTVQTALNAAAADAPAIESLAAALVSQANALTAQAAPLVNVVSNRKS